MERTWSDWALLPTSDVVYLAPSLLSGQSFRWTRGLQDENCFVGVLASTLIELQQQGEVGPVQFRCMGGNTRDAAALLHAHLRA